MRVYKFIGPKWGIDNLKNRHVKIGEFPDLNDPFELLPFVFPDAESEEAVLSWREDEGKEHGLCSYSRTPTNPVMWAHYTENHRGLCLGLEVPDAPEGTPEKLASPDHHAYLHPVTYVDTPYIFPVSSDGLNEELICRFLYTKFDHWRYEDEFRVYTTITDRNKKGLCFVNFGVNLVVKEVIVGYKSDVTAQKIRHSIDETYGDVVEIWKVRPSRERFEMVRDESFKP